ncbi:Gfo/Idh/MocA family protein [Brachybacterium sp. AOP43-C2-M15]|uniref:Gfo/Idh/MocA family protein n=1 Tax=Brachybacterium sp. AOP43-C2-M15 TaxID=3457661 RepID=UPI0040335132
MSTRIGVHGLGRIGAMHARNLARAAGVDEVVLIGRDAERLAGVERQLAASREEDEAADDRWAPVTSTLAPLEEALTGLDGVLVATATSTHEEIARTVARAGVPLLIEKPLSLASGALEELSTELEATGTPIMVAFHRRYDPGYQELRRRVEAGDVGTLRHVHAVDNDHYALPLDYIPQSHGMFLDLMIHDFDIIPWVVGEEVVEVTAIGSVLDEPVYAEHQDADTSVVSLRFASGAVGSVAALRRSGAGQDVRLEITGTDGAYGAGYGRRTPITSTEPGEPGPSDVYDTFSDRFVPAFEAEVDHFVAMVRGEAESLTPPRAGLHATAIAEAAGDSFRTGRPVRVRPTA